MNNFKQPTLRLLLLKKIQSVIKKSITTNIAEIKKELKVRLEIKPFKPFKIIMFNSKNNQISKILNVKTAAHIYISYYSSTAIQACGEWLSFSSYGTKWIIKDEE